MRHKVSGMGKHGRRNSHETLSSILPPVLLHELNLIFQEIRRNIANKHLLSNFVCSFFKVEVLDRLTQ